MAFLPDTNVWIFLLKNPGGKAQSATAGLPDPGERKFAQHCNVR
jgi:hypothetical protein